MDAASGRAVAVERVDDLDQPHHPDDRRQQRDALDRRARPDRSGGRRRGRPACSSDSIAGAHARLIAILTAATPARADLERQRQRDFGPLAQRRREARTPRACARRRRAARGRRRSAGSPGRSGLRRWRRRGNADERPAEPGARRARAAAWSPRSYPSPATRARSSARSSRRTLLGDRRDHGSNASQPSARMSNISSPAAGTTFNASPARIDRRHDAQALGTARVVQRGPDRAVARAPAARCAPGRARCPNARRARWRPPAACRRPFGARRRPRSARRPLARLEAQARVVAGEPLHMRECVGAPFLVGNEQHRYLRERLRTRRTAPAPRPARAPRRPSCPPSPARTAGRRRGAAARATSWLMTVSMWPSSSSRRDPRPAIRADQVRRAPGSSRARARSPPRRQQRHAQRDRLLRARDISRGRGHRHERLELALGSCRDLAGAADDQLVHGGLMPAVCPLLTPEGARVDGCCRPLPARSRCDHREGS